MLQAAEMGQIPILDAFFCIESGEDVRQMAMHMNPPSEFFPGITYPFDKVEDFTQEWLDQLPPGSIL